MSTDIRCPICTMPDPLIADDGYECATCGHEWLADVDVGVGEVRDVNGNLLADGDDVVIIKDLKLDGKTGGIKVGTKVKSIRLVPGDHPIDGKVNGRGVLIMAERSRRPDSTQAIDPLRNETPANFQYNRKSVGAFISSRQGPVADWVFGT